MNYLYINAIINETYQSLNCACPFPQAQLDRIVDLSINNDVLRSNVPGIMTFFSAKEDADTPILVFSRVLRHRNTASVGRMIQSLGWAWGKDVLTGELDSIFDAAFYTEEEVDALAKSGDPLPLPKDKEAAAIGPLPPLSAEVKAAVLKAMFLRWLLNEPAMRIAVPKTADYNSYVISAVKTIYRILPVGLRAEAGFCSYTPDPQNIMSRVYMGFIPEAVADSNTMFLDGSNQAAINSYNVSTGMSALDTLIDYLSRLPEEQLQTFLMNLYAEVEGDGDAKVMASLTAKAYLPIGEALQIITSEADLKTQIANWAGFFRNMEKHTPAMREEICNFIRKNATAQVLCGHFKEACANADSAGWVLDCLCKYMGFVKNNEALGAPLWEAALARCNEAGFTKQAMDAAATERKQDLTAFAGQEQLDALFLQARQEQLDGLKAGPAETTLQITERASEAKLLLGRIEARKAAGTEDLVSQIRAYLEALARQKSDLVFLDFQERLGKLAENTPQRPSEILAVKGEYEALLKAMRADPAALALEELIVRAEESRAALEKKAAASNTKLQAYYDKIQGNGSYFASLTALAESDLVSLDPQDRTELEGTLKSYRPASFRDYLRDFKDHYRKELNLQSVSELPAETCRRVLQDLCAMRAVSLPFEKDTDIQKFCNELNHLRYLAKHITGKTAVEVTMNGASFDADRFLQLLHATLKGKVEADESDFEGAIFTLMKFGVYKQNEAAMDKLFEVFRQNGWDLAYFAQGILTGAFGAKDSKEYTAIFEKLLNSFKKPNEKRAFVNELVAFCKEETTDRKAKGAFDDAAKKILEDQRKEQDRKRKAEEKRKAAEKKRGASGKEKKHEDHESDEDDKEDSDRSDSAPDSFWDEVEKKEREKEGLFDEQEEKKETPKAKLPIWIMILSGVLAVLLFVLVIVAVGLGKGGNDTGTQPSNVETTEATTVATSGAAD